MKTKKCSNMLRRASVLALSAAMVMAMGATAYAAPGDGTDPAPAASVSDRKVDEKLEIRGLQPGDSADFYKILKWVDGEGWKLADGLEGLSLDGTAFDAGVEITDAWAGAISDAVKANNIAVAFSGTAGDSGVLTHEGPDAGLYMAVIKPGSPEFVYNPVFLGADFTQENDGTDGSVIVFPDDGELRYGSDGKAKLSKFNVEKTAGEGDTSIGVGDTVSFTITTKAPAFGESYTNPMFKVSDKLSAGLKLDADSISVTGSDSYAKETSEDGFSIDFDATWLKSLKDAADITITYTATVVSEDAVTVDPEDNTVTVEYSNDPTDENSHGIIKDRTNHYLFSLDTALLGNSSYTSSEIVKVGEGELEEKILDNGETVKALEGAVFSLYKSANADGSDWELVSDEIKSDANGHMPMIGLDADYYYFLQETQAPEGYVKYQNVIKIQIVPDYGEVEVKDTDDDGNEIVYKTNILNSYTVNVWADKDAGEPQSVANYTITNEGPDVKNVSDATGKDDGTYEIVNKPGVELPSTGGIGTTIFYVCGGCLVLFAGVALVVRKRMGKGGSED